MKNLSFFCGNYTPSSTNLAGINEPVIEREPRVVGGRRRPRGMRHRAEVRARLRAEEDGEGSTFATVSNEVFVELLFVNNDSLMVGVFHGIVHDGGGWIGVGWGGGVVACNRLTILNPSP